MLRIIIAAGLCLSASVAFAAPAVHPSKPKASVTPPGRVINTPLDFMGFTAATTRDQVPDQISCPEYLPYYCSLTRTSVGGMVVKRSSADFNKITGKIVRVSFWTHSLFMKNAVELFTQKYGKPTTDKSEKKVNKTGGPYERRVVGWDFAGNDMGGAYLTMGEDELFVSVSWRENIGPIEKPKVDF